MGNIGSKKKSHRIVFLGLDDSGKSVLVRRMIKQTDMPEVTTSTSSCVYSTKFKGNSFNLWDIPGGQKVRSLWIHQINNLSVLCFVIDMSNEQRYPEALSELSKLSDSHQTKGYPILVVGNKADIASNVTLETLREKFLLDRPPGKVDYVLISGLNDTTFSPLFESLTSLITGGPKRSEKTKKSPNKEQQENPIKDKKKANEEAETTGESAEVPHSTHSEKPADEEVMKKNEQVVKKDEEVEKEDEKVEKEDEEVEKEEEKVVKESKEEESSDEEPEKNPPNSGEAENVESGLPS